MLIADKFEFNDVPEAKAQLNFAPETYIVDSTIRSLQSGVSGSLHTASDMIEIGAALSDIGVRELIVNLSWKDGFTVAEGLAEKNLSARVVGTFRARHPMAETWAKDGISAGCDEICFESANDADHFSRLADPVRESNRGVSHGFAEAYAYKEVVDIVRAGVALGCRSQSFHDSYFRFALTPEGAKAFYSALRRDVPDAPPLYIHLSNFYGNATMTAIASLAAGASAADVCMNGIGHHCGHIQMAEIVTALAALYGVDAGVKLDRLTEVSHLVRERTGFNGPLHSPVTGDNGFMIDGAYWAAEAHIPYEERIHAKFPIDPRAVGNVETVVWAPGTINTGSVRSKLGAMGIDNATVTDGSVEHIIFALEDLLRQRNTYPNWVTDREFEQLCRDVLRRGY
ncbi:hypothetical protein [Acuticoccus sediminis]|uniref:hypothetical protein n=1 Tax=Acuticoccus sediminis TaxID=2184697 RepID=UPI001CFCEDFF|nr:hypothetical protein [Acuticoccus sediminis]